MNNTTVYIYSLDDPNTGKPKYVGVTHNIKNRFSQHVKSKQLTNSPKDKWVRSLRENNQEPVLSILVESHESIGGFWEGHYVSLFRALGFDITNVSSKFGSKSSKREKRETFSFSAKESIIKIADRTADEKGLSRSQYIEMLLVMASIESKLKQK